MVLNNYSQRKNNKSKSLLGFCSIMGGSTEELQNIQKAINRVLKHFDDINQLTLTLGQTTITIWGRDKLTDCFQLLPNGNILFVIGSPVGNYSWQDLREIFDDKDTNGGIEIPCEGRAIFLQINPLSDTWTIWNDWIGSIPVFHANTNQGRIASTLEPTIVEVCGFNSDDIHPLGFLALLIWGHYFSDWTLFKDMKVIPPDGKATWDHFGFRFNQSFTVKPSEERWQAGWDDLIDEMHYISKSAISKSLNQKEQWILPLSGGLDSRLIAGVATELGKNIQAYTWGTPKSSEVVHAKRAASKLGIPWKRIDLGNKYLTQHNTRWADLFGSSMHFHGMYQIPFLDSITEAPGPIISGFIGECLAGYETKITWKAYTSETPYQILSDGWLHWKLGELRELINQPIDEQISEFARVVSKHQESIPGAVFQQLKFQILWGRQRHFTYFQSMMCDYWRGVSTPYLDRDYARFAFSLPKAVLDGRVLQRAMLRRYYPNLAAIPGTYAHNPALLTGSYLLKKRVARYFPKSLAKSVFPDLFRVKPDFDIGCVKVDGEKAFSPLFERFDQLKKWLNTDVVERNFNQIGSPKNRNAIRKLQSIQTLAFRL